VAGSVATLSLPKAEEALETANKDLSGNGRGWRHLRDNIPGVYETGADIARNQWSHVRLEIQGKRLTVYVNDGADPVLVVDPMLDVISRGTVGVWGWDTYFSNVRVTPAR
jgi:hypothetical protein